MIITRKSEFLKFVNNLVIDLPSPINISYAWNFGSLLGTILLIQIVSGIFLTIHYSPNVLIAFDSVNYIVREINYGWVLKNFHSTGASMFFYAFIFI